MRPDPHIHHESLDRASPPQEVERQIDCICDRFEADLRAGHSCDLDSLLLGVAVEYRPGLLRELLLIAVEYAQVPRRPRSAASQRPASDSTQRVFPTEADEPGNDSIPGDGEALPHGANVANTFGEFDLIEELGRGGMGVVYRAYQPRLGRTVAIKIILPHRLSGANGPRRDEAIRRFRREVQAAARLEHDSIVAIHDVGAIGEIPYYVMRFVDGQSLAEIAKDGPLEPVRAVNYMQQVARAVSLLHHAGVLHRDLKPSNILVESSTDRALVTDFGLAKLVDAPLEITATGDVFGSPSYMAPEQIRDSNRVTPVADVYSLGASLYHLLAGRPPFQAATLAETVSQVLKGGPVSPRQLNPAIDRDLETICLKCLELDPSHRYATARQLADDLERFQSGRLILARPISVGARLWRFAARHRAIAAMVAACAVLLICVAIGSLLLYESERRSAQLAEKALLESRSQLAQELLLRSDFASARDPIRSLPWLVESLRLTQGTAQERLDRLRIGSVLGHAPQARLLRFHDDRVQRAQFGPGDHQAFSAGSDGLLHIWSLPDGQCLRTIKHGSPIGDAKANRQGDRIATVGGSKVRVWNAVTGEEATAPLIHPVPVAQAAFSADGAWLITRGVDEHIRRWNLSTGQLELPLMSHALAPVTRMAIAQRGPIAVSAGGDQQVLVWDITTGEAIAPATQVENPVTALAISKDGTLQAVGCQDGRMCVKAIPSGDVILEGAHDGVIKQLRFSTNDKFLVMATAKTVNAWKIATKQRVATPIEQPNVTCLAFSSDTLLATGTMGGNVQVWDLASGMPRSCPLPHAKAVTDVAFSLSGNQLITASDDWGVRVWHWKPAVQRVPIGRSVALRGVKSADNGRIALSYGADHFAHVFCCRDGKQLGAPLKLKSGAIDATISHNGLFAVTAGSDRAATLWDLGSGQPLGSLMAQDAGLAKVSISPSGQLVTTADREGGIKLWKAPHGELVKQVEIGDAVAALAFSPDAEHLAVGAGKSFHLLKTQHDLKPDMEPLNYGAYVRVIQWSPTGKHLVVCAQNGIAQVWDSQSGTAIGQPMQSSSEIMHAAFNPAGTRLLFTGRDGNCQIWSTEQGMPLTPIFSHAGAATFGCFNQDASFVATCGQDRVSRIWDATSGQPVTIGFQHETAPIYAQFLEKDRLLVVTEGGQATFLDLAETPFSVDRLAEIARQRAHQRVSVTSGVTLLSPAEIKALHAASAEP